MLQKLQSIFKRKSAVLPEKLINIVGEIKNPNLYLEAITHHTIDNKNSKKDSYERLEFLGDATLGLIVSEYLFKKRPGKREGYLSKTRSKIVSRKHLNKIGEDLNLSDIMIKEANVTLSKDIEGDLLEAIIGAMFLDKGYQQTKQFVIDTIINSHVNLSYFDNEIQSFKSHLYEWSQKNKISINFNTFRQEENDHPLVFNCKIEVDDLIEVNGKGSSKKNAEEKASELAWNEIVEHRL